MSSNEIMKFFFNFFFRSFDLTSLDVCDIFMHTLYIFIIFSTLSCQSEWLWNNRKWRSLWSFSAKFLQIFLRFILLIFQVNIVHRAKKSVSKCLFKCTKYIYVSAYVPQKSWCNKGTFQSVYRISNIIIIILWLWWCAVGGWPHRLHADANQIQTTNENKNAKSCAMRVYLIARINPISLWQSS